jgi:Cu/Zn superoxide dismutase
VGRSYTYELRGVRISDLWGRSLIVHADEDDLGHGPHEDSGTTGHSGLRIGCAIFGRTATCGGAKRITRKRRHQ